MATALNDDWERYRQKLIIDYPQAVLRGEKCAQEYLAAWIQFFITHHGAITAAEHIQKMYALTRTLPASSPADNPNTSTSAAAPVNLGDTSASSAARPPHPSPPRINLSRKQSPAGGPGAPFPQRPGLSMEAPPPYTSRMTLPVGDRFAVLPPLGPLDSKIVFAPGTVDGFTPEEVIKHYRPQIEQLFAEAMGCSI